MGDAFLGIACYFVRILCIYFNQIIYCLLIVFLMVNQ